MISEEGGMRTSTEIVDHRAVELVHDTATTLGGNGLMSSRARPGEADLFKKLLRGGVAAAAANSSS